MGKRNAIQQSGEPAVDPANHQLKQTLDLMRRAAATTESVEGWAEQVSQTIRFVDDISFHIGLLSMKTLIETVHAKGDNGKLASVTGKIQALADHSAAVANELAALTHRT